MPNIRSSVITRPPASPRSLVVPAAPAPSLARILLIHSSLVLPSGIKRAPGLAQDTGSGAFLNGTLITQVAGAARCGPSAHAPFFAAQLEPLKHKSDIWHSRRAPSPAKTPYQHRACPWSGLVPRSGALLAGCHRRACRAASLASAHASASSKILTGSSVHLGNVG
jgi:hypothetical protein